MNQQAEYCLAVDIGGTKVDIALMDPGGRVYGNIHHELVPFDDHGVADPGKLIDLLHPFINQALQKKLNLKGIGLAICGNINSETGEAVLVPNLHWRYLPFGEMVRSAFGLPVHYATDVRQAAIAEHLWGIARQVRNFAWCTVGTGYGGYLFLEGKLFSGSHGFAGNFGHITLDEVNGYPCGCGRRGCFETFVSGPAIARYGQAAVDRGQSSVLFHLAADKPVTTQMVIQASNSGDKVANDILDQVIRLISINLGGVVNLLDLDMIVMGGGVVNAIPNFIQRINDRIRDYLMTEEAKRDLRVEKETFPNSTLFGAAGDFFLQEGVLKE